MSTIVLHGPGSHSRDSFQPKNADNLISGKDFLIDAVTTIRCDRAKFLRDAAVSLFSSFLFFPFAPSLPLFHLRYRSSLTSHCYALINRGGSMARLHKTGSPRSYATVHGNEQLMNNKFHRFTDTRYFGERMNERSIGHISPRQAPVPFVRLLWIRITSVMKNY